MDTSIGGRGDRFPATQWSAIIAAGSTDPTERERALDTLITAYWKPVYKYVRIKWRKSNEDAKDLTQGFFAAAIEKDFFKSYDPAKARFRTFLRICLDAFISNEEKAARRLKRGGDRVLLSIDFESAEDEITRAELPAPDALDEYFDKEWVRSLFGLAVDNLKAECEAKGKIMHFRLFESYYLDEADEAERVTYDRLARESGLSTSNVTNYLAYARREFRRIVLERLREITATDEEFRREARSLLGVEIE
ncbi:MAG: sigma-70 family RNA polymerase sigma factor [Blastocatellia bacterium]|nr:sigma-70 family RNA polymerase sigma factor [Blastocatellia bacterium]